VFAVLRDTSTLTTVFTSVLGTMTLVGVLAVLASLRTGPIRDASDPR